MRQFKEMVIRLKQTEEILTILIQQNCDRPNGMDDDEIIESHMNNNYPCEEYEVLNFIADEEIILDEEEIWSLPQNID